MIIQDNRQLKERHFWTTHVNLKWTFCMLGSGFAQVFRQIVSTRVKTLSHTNLVALIRHMKMKEASQRFMCVAQKRLCVGSLTSNSHNITNLINHIVPASATQYNTLSAVLRLHFRLARCGIEFPHGRQTDPLYNRQDTVQVLWQPCSQVPLLLCRDE